MITRDFSLKVLSQCIDIKNPSIFRSSRALAEAAGGEDQPAIPATSFGIAFLVIQVLEIERWCYIIFVGLYKGYIYI